MTRNADQDAPRSPQDGGSVVISVDAMGGDLGPAAVIGGIAASAAKNPDIRFIVHGPEAELTRLIAKKRGLAERCEIRDAAGVVTMNDKPGQVIRNAQGTSMLSAIDSVRAGDASVAVSCGNTGALMALSMLRLRKLPGVNRPAIACLWPSRNPQGFNVMLDCGADIRADAPDLLQYALMGAAYARNGLGLKRPRLGLLNVGTEEHKGRSELRQAHDLIAAAQDTGNFDYIGFVEGGDLLSARADVIVTDGFTGNVALKTGEGTAKLVGDFLREAFNNSFMSKIAARLALTSLKRLQKRIDPRRVNGGVFLGL
ncbi:MAG: phosphate acyltransferase PlsX, partial [Paracoccus sp. (in: a-proteobacteria)]|nr:phosphate acyltransferase PlsX [Paracoccus sp. (in: a-proteobacteria)]